MPHLSDSVLAVLNYLAPIVLGALGVIFELLPKPLQGKRWKILVFIVLAVVGCFLSYDQGSRAQADATTQHAEIIKLTQGRNIESGKIDAMNGVVQTLATNIKSQIFSEAAAQAQAIAKLGGSIGKQLAAQPSLPNSSKPQSLIERATATNHKLQGLDKDWNAQFNKMEADIKTREANYPTNTDQIRSADIESNEKEISWKQGVIDKNETDYYRNTYEKEAEELRSELVPLLPGVSDPSISYKDNSQAAPGYPSFWEIANDFNSLVAAYGEKLKSGH